MFMKFLSSRLTDTFFYLFFILLIDCSVDGNKTKENFTSVLQVYFVVVILCPICILFFTMLYKSHRCKLTIQNNSKLSI